MAHTPVEPSGTTVSLSLTEDTEFYICPSGDTLNSGDLISNTSGDIDAAPTRQITRVPLHNGLDYVSPGALQSQPFTIRTYLPASDAKMTELYAAYESGDFVKFNAFNRDGTGYAGFAIVTRIKPTTDPAANEFAQEITFEPFNVEVLEL